MPTVALDDIEVYYEVVGSGPRLLMFNGSGGSIEIARLLVDSLAAHFEVLVHDQRALGRTTVPETLPTMADYARDAAALLDHVGWPTTRVFGISFGGMVAQEFAATYPARVERMALVCTSSGGIGGSSYPLHELATLPAEERAAIALHNLDTRFDADWLATHPFDRAIADNAAQRALAPRTDEQRRGEAMQLQARRAHDVWDRLGTIACPVLIACGEFDGVAPPANSEAIHRAIPGSVLRMYQGGHLFIYQDRQALPDVVEFLA
jgi:3-oxoadipate enol-lactonase